MCYEIHSSASGTMKILYSRLKRTAANSSAKVALQFFIEHFSLLSTAEMGGGQSCWAVHLWLFASCLVWVVDSEWGTLAECFKVSTVVERKTRH